MTEIPRGPTFSFRKNENSDSYILPVLPKYVLIK